MGEEYQVVKRRRDYHGCVVCTLGKEGKGKEYLHFYIKTVGKNIKLGRGEGNGNFGELILNKIKLGLGKNIKL